MHWNLTFITNIILFIFIYKEKIDPFFSFLYKNFFLCVILNYKHGSYYTRLFFFPRFCGISPEILYYASPSLYFKPIEDVFK
jgi:hypothetical protein